MRLLRGTAKIHREYSTKDKTTRFRHLLGNSQTTVLHTSHLDPTMGEGPSRRKHGCTRSRSLRPIKCGNGYARQRTLATPTHRSTPSILNDQLGWSMEHVVQWTASHEMGPKDVGSTIFQCSSNHLLGKQNNGVIGLKFPHNRILSLWPSLMIKSMRIYRESTTDYHIRCILPFDVGSANPSRYYSSNPLHSNTTGYLWFNPSMIPLAPS